MTLLEGRALMMQMQKTNNKTRKPAPVQGQKMKFKKSAPVQKTENVTRKKQVQQESKESNSLPEKPKITVKIDGKWWESPAVAQITPESMDKSVALTKTEVATIQAKAEKLLEKDTHAYKAESMRGDQRSDVLWMEKLMKTGTLPDKMAAFTVRIQESPVHNLYALQQLVGMVKIQGKQQCLMTADTTRDLFLEDLLPPHRKLIPFENRGSHLRTASNKQLIMWIFEDKLKGLYRDFIEALRKMASDTVDKLRGKAISVIYQLLSSHPEQESILLPQLVNKLGDPTKKVGSRALFHLSKLLDIHPQMKIVVVEEVERLLFRNNIAKRAQYYGICFLNIIRIVGDEAKLAVKLIKLYLAFFKACIKTGEIDSKMMSGLLTGVNKAFPVAKMEGFEFTESLDTLYKIVQLSQFNVGVQALALLLQIIDVEKNPAQADRYYRVLYRRLLSPEVATTSHAMQFLNVIFKAMKKDNVLNRVIGFTKRLLQLCNNMPPNLACSILFLISEVSKTHKDILLLGTPESVKNETDNDSSTDSDSEDDAKSKSKKESSTDRKLRKELKAKKAQLEVDKFMKTSNIQFIPEDEEKKVPEKQPLLPANGVKDASDDVVEIKSERESLQTEYDPAARNPAYSGAHLTLAYELACLSQHFHPSVALFSHTLLNRKFIQYDGNPLKDFTVARFLERFVYRNAKAKRVKQEYKPQGLRNIPVNSIAYLKNEEGKIPVEERFFYKYFKETDKGQKPKAIKEEETSDVESVDDEEFEEMMGNYFKTNGALASDDDEDEDEDVDFAAQIKASKTKKGKKKRMDVDEDEDSVDEDDEAIDFEGDDDADEFVNEDSEEEDDDLELGGDFEDDDNVEEFGGKDFKSKLSSKIKLQSGGKKLKMKKGDDMFAPAEQFAEMLEANAEDAFSGSNTLINKDNSDVKQLKWETDRDRWVKGYKRSNKTQFASQKSKKRKLK